VITGRFGNTTGRPYVSGRVFLPRIRAAANLSFLVDTGADSTTLMPPDALRMGIDHSSLVCPMMVGGIGGNSVCNRESAVLAFDESNRNLIRFYFITILIPPPDPDLMRMPPILGRDVLDRWRMNYDRSKNNLSFAVRSADHTVRISTAASTLPTDG
jgi:hypothetical protein